MGEREKKVKELHQLAEQKRGTLWFVWLNVWTVLTSRFAYSTQKQNKKSNAATHLGMNDLIVFCYLHYMLSSYGPNHLHQKIQYSAIFIKADLPSETCTYYFYPKVTQ